MSGRANGRMVTETVSLADLHPPERNVRMHPEEQIIELARAVDMFGQTRPVVVDEDNTILAGNGLVTAMQHLGRKTAQVLRMTGLSPAAKTKLILSDNKIYQLGHDDYDGIMTLIRSLDDFEVPGFDADLLASLVSNDITAAEALAGFGHLTEEERLRTSRIVRPQGSNSDTPRVTCPHCGKEFILQ